MKKQKTNKPADKRQGKVTPFQAKTLQELGYVGPEVKKYGDAENIIRRLKRHAKAAEKKPAKKATPAKKAEKPAETPAKGVTIHLKGPKIRISASARPLFEEFVGRVTAFVAKDFANVLNCFESAIDEKFGKKCTCKGKCKKSAK